MQYGARNCLEGEIVNVKKGQLMCQVTLKVPADATMCSVFTLDSLKQLGVKEGDKVKILVKAVNVLLATE
jgi:molybdopterin-binding protein